MADNKFKTAAARLLALHAPEESGETVNKTETAVAATTTVDSTPEAPQKKPVIVWRKNDSSSQSAKQPVFPPNDFSDSDDEADAPPFFAGRRRLILLPALIGSGIMTVLIPPTIFGILGNIALGFLVGAALGIIIAKEL